MVIKKLRLDKLRQILTLADKIAIISIFMISIALIFATPHLMAGTSEDKQAVVTVEGEEVYRLDIVDTPELERVNFDFEVDGSDYEGVLKMKDGSVKLERLNKDIVPLPIHNQMGWISKNHETIVAMPVAMVISIEDSKETESDVDVMTF